MPTPGPSSPSWPERAEEAWRVLPPREFLGQRAPRAQPTSSRLVRADGQHYHSVARKELQRVAEESACIGPQARLEHQQGRLQWVAL